MIAYSDFQDGNDAIEIPDNPHNEINWLEGNIDENPLFTNPDEGDFSLIEDSPCIDVGTAFLVIDGDTLVNMSDDMYYGEAPDMGAFEYGFSAVDSESNKFPTGFNLFPAYPNPFNSTTKITYCLPVASLMSLRLYDLSGREVRTLFDGRQQPGVHTSNLTGVALPSGLYFIRLETPGEALTQKVILVR